MEPPFCSNFLLRDATRNHATAFISFCDISFKTVGLMIRTIDFWSAILWRFYDSLYLLHRTAPFHIEDTGPKIRVFLPLLPFKFPPSLLSLNKVLVWTSIVSLIM
jgi:hypothetical protein